MEGASNADRFMTNITDMVDLVKELITDCYAAGLTKINPVLIDAAGVYMKTFGKDKLIDSFAERSHKYWSLIYHRDKRFFIENASSVFQDLPMNDVDAFKVLFSSDDVKDEEGNVIVSGEDQEGIWLYFDSIIKISIKYIHEKRGPTTVIKDGVARKVYSKEVFRDIKVKKYAKMWKVDLSW